MGMGNDEEERKMKRKGRWRFQMRIWRGYLLSTCQKCVKAICWRLDRTRLLLPFFIRKGAGSQPGLPGSTGFLRANFQTSFYLDPDRFQAWVGRVPGRPAGPVRVSKLCSVVLKQPYKIGEILPLCNWELIEGALMGLTLEEATTEMHGKKWGWDRCWCEKQYMNNGDHSSATWLNCYSLILRIKKICKRP